ncbi:MAG TPA: hypothetical protein VGI85_11070 [Chthoniobacterales bacterium]
MVTSYGTWRGSQSNATFAPLDKADLSFYNRGGERSVPPKTAPARGSGVTSDGALVLLIGLAIVGVIAWLALSYSESTGEDAHAFAEQTIRRLVLAHPFCSGAAAIYNSSLTNLGTPTQPYKVEGEVSYGSDPGKQDPEGHFRAHLLYPSAQADLYLGIARREGRWQIDGIDLYWMNNQPLPAAVPSV